VSGGVAGAAARCGQRREAGAPLDLGPYHVDDLVWQAGNALVAEVDGDAGLLLLQLAGRRLGGGAQVAAGVLEGGFGQGHDLVVRDGRGRVVAHCGRGLRGEPGDAAGESVADMLLAGGARRGQDRTGQDSGREKYRMKSAVTQCVVRSTGAAPTSLAWPAGTRLRPL
jgi:hypothetical protein